jgi:DNA-binding XRE family transcriptional regulator
MRHEVADAFYAANVDDPLAVCEVACAAVCDVGCAGLRPGWQPVTDDELRELLSVGRDLVYGSWWGPLPPSWKMTLGLSLTLLERALGDRRAVSHLQMVEVIRYHVEGHRWHIAAVGHDPFAESREALFGIVARLIVERPPKGWAAFLIEKPWTSLGRPNPAAFLRHQRHAAGLAQADVAHKLGVARSTVVRWESGERHPRPAHAAALAQLLGGHAADYEPPSS